MYVEAKVKGKKLQTTMDTGADTMYTTKELTYEFCLPYKKERGMVKGVNAKSLPIHWVARGADIQSRLWSGHVDIIVAPLDNHKFYLRMDFLDRAKAFIAPYASTLFIMVDGQVHLIPIRQDAKKEKVLAAFGFPKDKEPGYLASFTRGNGPICVKPPIPPGTLASGRTQVYWKVGSKQKSTNMPNKT